MGGNIDSPRLSLRTHWFFVVAPLVLLVDASAIVLDNWQSPRILEAGLLFDWAVLIPLLYLFCYRSRGKQALAKCIALACLGIWAAGFVVPEANHSLLERLGFFRYVGLGVLVVVELKLIAAIYRAVFKTDATVDEVASDAADASGVPLWVTRLMAWEATIWRRLWRLVKRLFS